VVTGKLKHKMIKEIERKYRVRFPHPPCSSVWIAAVMVYICGMVVRGVVGDKVRDERKTQANGWGTKQMRVSVSEHDDVLWRSLNGVPV
jgi:hypothetical protein